MAKMTHGGFSVTIGPDGAIRVKPGDWVSKYSAAIHGGDTSRIHEYGRLVGGKLVPLSNPNKILAGEIIYHIPTYNAAKAGRIGASTAQQQGLELVNAFALRTSQGAFTAISRSDVATSLKHRVNHPDAINQGQAGVCPSAAIVYLEAKSHPLQYAQFVIDLYEKGQGTINNWTVKPGTDLKHYRPPANQIDPADWIAMASIRDSENWLFDYQKIEGWGPWSGGASSSEMARWLKKAGYTDVRQEDNNYFTKGRQNLEEASRLRSRGYKVILVLDADIFTLPPNKLQDESPRWAGRANHVVVLTSPVTIRSDPSKDTVDFTVYTWGQGGRSIVPSGASRLLLSVFLRYYYGFTAGKY